jgi:hypothetical protein
MKKDGLGGQFFPLANKWLEQKKRTKTKRKTP